MQVDKFPPKLTGTDTEQVGKYMQVRKQTCKLGIAALMLRVTLQSLKITQSSHAFIQNLKSGHPVGMSPHILV